jgi:hypothetical protein
VSPRYDRPDDQDGQYAVSIPADVERDDKILFGLTGRQVAILSATGAAIWLAYAAVGQRLPLPVFAALALPVVAAGALLAWGRRDGISADRLALAAFRHARTPRRQVLAPEGVPHPPGWVDTAARPPSPGSPVLAPLRLPVEAISPDGVIDLGDAGVAVIAETSTVSFALRAPREQLALVAGFARWLNSLTAPVHILVRAEWVDLAPMAAGLEENAPTLPHPALEAAAHEHAAFLDALGSSGDLVGELLRRQVLLVVTEPHPGRDRRQAAERCRQRLDGAARALAAADITVTPLDGGQVTALLATAANPLAPARPLEGWAAPDQVITGELP